mgnify:FL=1
MSVYHHVSKYQLPHYLSIEIEHTDGSKYVIVHSTIHVEKINKTGMAYSDEFTDDEILNDERVFKYICDVYGMHLETKLVSK